jgi:hypothetical protein
LSSAYGPRNPKVMNAKGLYEESQVPKEISQIVKQNKINAKFAQTQRNIQAGQQLQRTEALNSNIFWNIEQLYINPLINVGLDINDGNYGKAVLSSTLMLFDLGSVGKFTVQTSKFDYFFGRVVTGDIHNVQRSAQNLKDLTTLGIKDETQIGKF